MSERDVSARFESDKGGVLVEVIELRSAEGGVEERFVEKRCHVVEILENGWVRCSGPEDEDDHDDYVVDYYPERRIAGVFVSESNEVKGE